MSQTVRQKRSNGGRPPLTRGVPTLYVGTKVDAPTQARLSSAAKRMGLRMSDVVRSALTNWLDAFDAACR